MTVFLPTPAFTGCVAICPVCGAAATIAVIALVATARVAVDVDRAHRARARLHARRARLNVEGEFRSALAELDRVVGKDLDLAGNALAVDERAVAAFQVLDREGERVRGSSSAAPRACG